MMIPFLLICPIEVTFIAVLLWKLVGRAAIAGIAVCIVLAIFHVFCGVAYGKIR